MAPETQPGPIPTPIGVSPIVKPPVGIPVGVPPVAVPPVVSPPAGGLGNGGTIATPSGSIPWTQSADGTINASGGGQTLTASGKNEANGSWHKQSAFAQSGQAPYLTVQFIGDVASRKVAYTQAAGSSELTLTVADIDAGATSGVATLSGTWNGATVSWTAHVDLTTNPLTSQPIKGWPAGAFATELQRAAFFAPLGTALSRASIPFPAPTTGTGGGEHADDASNSLGNAGAWCIGGAVAGAIPGGVATGPVGAAIGGIAGCVGGATGSLLSDLNNWANPAPINADPPVIDLPPEPEPILTVTSSAADNPPPPASDGGGDGSGGDSGGGAQLENGPGDDNGGQEEQQ